MTLATDIEQHQLKLLAMAWLDKHYDDLPICGCADVPQSWIDDLTAELEAAIEDRGQEWLEKKRC